MAFSKISSQDCSITAVSYLFTLKSYLSEGLGPQHKLAGNQKSLSHRSDHQDCSVYFKAHSKIHLSCTTGKEEHMNSHKSQPGMSQKLLLPKARVSTQCSQFSNNEVCR